MASPTRRPGGRRPSAPILGGLLAAHAGFRLLFLVDAGTTVVYALITFARVAETQSRATPVGSRVPVLVADRALLGVVLLNACFAIVSFQGQSTLPIVLARHDIRSSAYGLVLAAGTLAFAHAAPAYAATVAVWSLGALAVTPLTSALVSELAPLEAQGRYQGRISCRGAGAGSSRRRSAR